MLACNWSVPVHSTRAICISNCHRLFIPHMQTTTTPPANGIAFLQSHCKRNRTWAPSVVDGLCHRIPANELGCTRGSLYTIYTRVYTRWHTHKHTYTHINDDNINDYASEHALALLSCGTFHTCKCKARISFVATI